MDRTDELRASVVEANDLLFKLKEELTVSGVNEGQVPSVKKIQKALLKANTISTILVQHVEAI